MNGLAQIIITVGAVVTACLTVFGVCKSLAGYIYSLKNNSRMQSERNTAQDKAIARLKVQTTPYRLQKTNCKNI